MTTIKTVSEIHLNNSTISLSKSSKTIKLDFVLEIEYNLLCDGKSYTTLVMTNGEKHYLNQEIPNELIKMGF